MIGNRLPQPLWCSMITPVSGFVRRRVLCPLVLTTALRMPGGMAVAAEKKDSKARPIGEKIVTEERQPACGGARTKRFTGSVRAVSAIE